MRMPRFGLYSAGLCALLGACAVVLVAQTQQGDWEWRHYSADNAATKYAPLDQINRSNVASLRVAWRRPQVPPA